MMYNSEWWDNYHGMCHVVSASDEGVEHLSTSAALGRKLMKSGLPLTQV
jgi:hypothetical protein